MTNEQREQTPPRFLVGQAVGVPELVAWAVVPSAVVVTALTTQYAACQADRAERMRIQNLVRRLDTEISNRIYYAGIDLKLIQQNTDYQSRERPDGKETLEWTVSSLYKRMASFLDNSVPNPDWLVAGSRIEVSVFPRTGRAIFMP